MMKKAKLLGLLSSLVLLFAAGDLASAGPLEDLQNANQKLNTLAKARASDAKLKRFVNKLIDFDTMAKDTLQAQWAKLTPAQRTEFTKLLRGLVEKTYIKGIRKNAKYTVKYKREALIGASAKVHTEVHTVRRGRPRQTEVVYRMRKKGRRWVMTDMVTDDVSMVRQYRKSFTRIINKRGFDELLRKMRKKLGQ